MLSRLVNIRDDISRGNGGRGCQSKDGRDGELHGGQREALLPAGERMAGEDRGQWGRDREFANGGREVNRGKCSADQCFSRSFYKSYLSLPPARNCAFSFFSTFCCCFDMGAREHKQTKQRTVVISRHWLTRPGLLESTVYFGLALTRPLVCVTTCSGIYEAMKVKKIPPARQTWRDCKNCRGSKARRESPVAFSRVQLMHCPPLQGREVLYELYVPPKDEPKLALFCHRHQLWIEERAATRSFSVSQQSEQTNKRTHKHTNT